VLSNKAMLELSVQRPQDLGALSRTKGMPSWLVRHQGQALLAAIRQGERQPLAWGDRPRFSNGNNRKSSGRNGGRPSVACKARFEALRAWRNAAAEAKGVEPDIILNNQSLWAVAAANPRSQADLADDGLLAPWQVDEFGNELLTVVKKEL
jgi:ribonuclease D